MKINIRYKEKKGQIQSMELIAVLFVFFILLSVGIYYYYQFQFSDIKERNLSLSRERLEVYLSSIPHMAEFQCSFRGSDEICMDIAKVLLFRSSEIAKNVNLPRARISLRQVYPPKTITRECTLQDFGSGDFPDNCNKYIIKDLSLKGNKNLITIPTLLYFPTKNLYTLGILSMETE